MPATNDFLPSPSAAARKMAAGLTCLRIWSIETPHQVGVRAGASATITLADPTISALARSEADQELARLGTRCEAASSALRPHRAWRQREAGASEGPTLRSGPLRGERLWLRWGRLYGKPRLSFAIPFPPRPLGPMSCFFQISEPAGQAAQLTSGEHQSGPTPGWPAISLRADSVFSRGIPCSGSRRSHGRQVPAARHRFSAMISNRPTSRVLSR